MFQSKCIAACQSSVELIKHLSSLLVEQCQASPEEARIQELENLTRKFDQLLARNKAKEKENSEARLDFAFYLALLVALYFGTELKNYK